MTDENETTMTNVESDWDRQCRESRERTQARKMRNELIGEGFLADDPDGPDLLEKLRRQAVALDTLFQYYVKQAQGHDNQHHYVQAFRSQQQYCKTLEVMHALEKANILKEIKKNGKSTKMRLSKRDNQNE